MSRLHFTQIYYKMQMEEINWHKEMYLNLRDNNGDPRERRNITVSDSVILMLPLFLKPLVMIVVTLSWDKLFLK